MRAYSRRTEERVNENSGKVNVNGGHCEGFCGGVGSSSIFSNAFVTFPSILVLMDGGFIHFLPQLGKKMLRAF